MHICCYGDSNTYGYDPRSYLGGRYPKDARWVDLLAEETGWNCRNNGMNGRTVPRAKISAEADLLIVMLGTNDLLQGASAKETAARMEACLPRDQRILLIAPPLQRGEWVTEAALGESGLLAAQYCALARKCGVRFADAAAWDIPLAYDGVHFTEEGHRHFAAALCRFLREKELDLCWKPE